MAQSGETPQFHEVEVNSILESPTEVKVGTKIQSGKYTYQFTQISDPLIKDEFPGQYDQFRGISLEKYDENNTFIVALNLPLNSTLHLQGSPLGLKLTSIDPTNDQAEIQTISLNKEL
jgi:hypothetical protein